MSKRNQSGDKTQAKLSRIEIRKILSRHNGSKAEVARDAHVTRQTVNDWLNGKNSANVAAAAEKRALALLELERKLNAA